MLIYSCVGKAKFSAAITPVFFDEYKGKQKKNAFIWNSNLF